MSAPVPMPLVDLERVTRAREMLREVVPASRLVEGVSLSGASGARVFLKLESEGPTGSFKVRGAYHALQRRMEQGAVPGVVTSSTGNHGAAVAFAARRLGLACRVYLPKNPNSAKRARIAREGAEIVEAGEYLEASREHAARFARESGWFNVVDGVEPELLPGTATIGCEIAEQLPGVEVIYVPVGDTTLVRGLAFAAKKLRPGVRIVGVQAERAPAYALSFEQGRAVSTESSDTIADGLAVRQALEENVRQVAALVDEFALVSEEAMLAAIRHLSLGEHVLAEAAGAATTAALLKRSRAEAGKTVVLIVSGANIPEEQLRQALRAG